MNTDQRDLPLTSTGRSGKKRWRVTRRGFLIGAGVVGSGLFLGWRFGLPEMRLRVAEMTSGSGSFGNQSNDPNAWFAITPNTPERVRLYLTKVEMGQGIHTALAQIAAEELDVPVSALEITQANTGEAWADSAGTSGSFSVSSLFTPLRVAAATLREMLAAEAAKSLGVSRDALTQDGAAFALKSDAGKRITFGDVVATKTATKWEVPEKSPALKPIDQLSVVGASEPRVDVPDKVTGASVYGYDARMDGMLYGAVLRPPTLTSTLKSVAPGTAGQIEGVKHVVIDKDFAGVVATSRTAARAGVAALQADWQDGKVWQQTEIDQIVTVGNGEGVTIQRVGNAPAELGADVIEAEYRTPFAIQTPLEAQAALADVKADRAVIYASSQSQFSVRRYVAQAIGLKEEQITVQPTYLGGGFGRKAGWEVAIEAARLSKVAGVPVHVGWTREEELRYGFVRPPTHHRMRARIQDGRIVALEHGQASGKVLFTFFPQIAAAILGADFGTYRGAQLTYDAIPNRHTITWLKDLPIKTGPWRGLGLLPNVFAIESFMDELAAAANIDPLEWRLRHLGESDASRRMKAALQAVADKAGWRKPLPEGRAHGIACSIDADTAVAQVAEVSVDRESGKINVHRIALAMDCGLAINPDGVAAQAQGGVMWGVGSALVEEARIEDGVVSARNFDGYPLLSMKDAPQVDVVLLDTLKDGKPRGVGEPPMGPTVAAIGNAFFALTGKRLRQIPFTAERVKAALGN